VNTLRFSRFMACIDYASVPYSGCSLQLRERHVSRRGWIKSVQRAWR
jgi:hypothetical protein